MRQYSLIAALTALFITTACSTEPKPKSLETVVKGTLTISDSVSGSEDYSGTGVAIVMSDTTEMFDDTLFYQTTDESGYFEGTVQFPEKKYYALFISRDSSDIGNMAVILAKRDTVTINAELPDLEQTLSITSREHKAMQTFTRVDRGFQRVRAFARSGVLSDSLIVDEIVKWTDLYWQVYEKNPGTLAAFMAAEQSAILLSLWNQEEMLKRIDKALPDDYMINVALNLGKPYIAENKGFNVVSNYLDSLSNIAMSKSARELIAREKIKIYFDSSRVKEAKKLLTDYEENYSDNPASKKWARRIRYDLNYLAPGVTAPDFSFMTMQGDTITNEALKGDVYILEISPLANEQYQDDYDRTLIINEIYKNYGLKIFSIPLDESEITVNAFFEERRKAWQVAKLGSFDVQQIIQKFNVTKVPTRFLIDENGVLIRKYEQDEFQDVIQGLNKAFRNINSPS